MINSEHILEKMKEWSRTHDEPIKRSDLFELGIPHYVVKSALTRLKTEGKIRRVTRGEGWVVLV